MAQGTANEPRPVVLPEDEGKPKKEQTVFWVKPRKHDIVDRSSVDYGRSRRTQGRGGFDDFDPDRVIQADKKTWVRLVHHIDRFFFSIDFADKYWTEEDKKAERQLEGIDIHAGDTAGLMDVLADLLEPQTTYVLAASGDIEEGLTPAERKKNRGSLLLGGVRSGKSRKQPEV